MLDRPPIAPSDFFSNAAAQAAGFTDEFWFDAFNQWTEALHNDAESFFIAIDSPRTFRMPFRDGYADVLVRNQPDGREYYAIRFTAFPADDEPTPRQIDRWYMYDESRPVLGEAILADVNFPW